MSIIDRTKLGIDSSLENDLMSLFQAPGVRAEKILIGITHDPFIRYHGNEGEASSDRGQMVLVAEGRMLKRVRRDFEILEKKLGQFMGSIRSLPVERADNWELNEDAAYFYVYAWIQ